MSQKEDIEIRMTSGRRVAFELLGNSSYYPREQLKALMLWAFEQAAGTPGLSEFGVIPGAALRGGKASFGFGTYRGKKKCLLAIQGIGGWAGETFVARIKPPDLALSPLELMAAGANVPREKQERYAAQMPESFRRQLAAEMHASLIKTTASKPGLDLQLFGATPPELWAYHTARKAPPERRLNHALERLTACRDTPAGALGEHLSSFISSNSKHVKKVRTQAKVLKEKELEEASTRILALLEELRAFEKDFSQYSALLQQRLIALKEEG